MLGVRRRDLLSIALIVLITAAAITVVIPLPLSEQAKEAQRLIKCQSNLKRSITAVQMYWNDYDGMLPCSVLASSTPGAAPTQDEVVMFLTGKNPWPLPDGARPRSWSQILSPYFKQPGVVFCPSDTPKSRVSYWWKYAVDLAWRDPVNMVRRENDYGDPSNQILLYEHAGWHWGSAAGIKDNIKINAAFMDGHITTITLKNGPTAYPSPINERDGTSSIRLGAPMYYNYDNTTQQRHTGVADYVDPRRYSDRY